METIETLFADLAAVDIEVDGEVAPVAYWQERPEKLTPDLLPLRILQEPDIQSAGPGSFLVIGDPAIVVNRRIEDTLFYRPVLSGDVGRMYEREMDLYKDAWMRKVAQAYRAIGGATAEVLDYDPPPYKLKLGYANQVYYVVRCTVLIRHYLTSEA